MSTKISVLNTIRPPNWKGLAPALDGPATFSRQSELPELPVPSLSSMAEKLGRSLKALAQSDGEWKLTKDKLDQFASEGGLGQLLQRRLEQRADRPDVDHWLEEFWDDTAYLKYREPVMINVSYYWGFSPQPDHLPQGPVARAATLTRGALLFRRMLKQGILPPETIKGQALCMDSYRWMFDSCRVPGLGGADWAVSAAGVRLDGNSGHVIVLRHGRVWKLDISATTEDRLLSTAELERQFQVIYQSKREGCLPLGTLTTTDRDAWAKSYALLVSDPVNSSVLEAIISSAFVVCLDYSSPESVYEVSRGLFHGGPQGEQLGNRWYDKPCEFIVFDNGEAGFLGEHSMMDGTSTSALCHWILDSLDRKTFDHGGNYPSSGDFNPQATPAPQALEWRITSSISEAIALAIDNAKALIARQDLGLLTIPYGRSTIKNFGFSPDAWTQLLVQLAYHRLLGGKSHGRARAGGTYESAMTRKFLRGRTEAIRVVSDESMAWCDSMDEEISTEDKVYLLKAAAKVHGLTANDAANGQGVDRHLLGLRRMLLEEEGLPGLFSDPLYIRGSHWVLSTSAVFSPYFTRGYGWGQVVENGFGVAYMTGFTDRLEFTITSFKSQPNAQFLAELRKAAADMQHLFDN